VIAAGIIVGLLLFYFRARQKQLDTAHLLNLSFWMIVGGIVGSRIWHLLTPPFSMIQAGFTTRFYLTHPLDAVSIWNGGLGLPGTILGIGLSMLLYCRKHRLPLFTWADVLAPAWLAVQIIGVWGNFITQTAYGKPTNLPWAIEIGLEHRLPGYEQVAAYHPLFLYSCLLNIALFIMLLMLQRRMNHLSDGLLFTIFLVGFGFVHFLLEFIRFDVSFWGSLPINQLFMGLLTCFSLAALIIARKQARKTLQNQS